MLDAASDSHRHHPPRARRLCWRSPTCPRAGTPKRSTRIARGLHQGQHRRAPARHPTDPDHHRSVFTIAGGPGSLADATLRGATEAVARIDLRDPRRGASRIGAIDVAPIIYLREQDEGAAYADALVLGDMLGDELELPVFLYGALADGRTRAELRRGGLTGLAKRIGTGELRPDFGPTRLHPTAGAVLVAARPPLVAFNVELARTGDARGRERDRGARSAKAARRASHR